MDKVQWYVIALTFINLGMVLARWGEDLVIKRNFSYLIVTILATLPYFGRVLKWW